MNLERNCDEQKLPENPLENRKKKCNSWRGPGRGSVGEEVEAEGHGQTLILAHAGERGGDMALALAVRPLRSTTAAGGCGRARRGRWLCAEGAGEARRSSALPLRHQPVRRGELQEAARVLAGAGRRGGGGAGEGPEQGGAACVGERGRKDRE